MEIGSHSGGQSNAAGFCREDHGDLVHIKILAEFLSDPGQQSGVDAVVQETVHLDDIAGQNLALFYDPLLQLLHLVLPLCAFYLYYLYNRFFK